MFTNPWTTCQGAATPYYFYLFKSDNVRKRKKKNVSFDIFF